MCKKIGDLVSYISQAIDYGLIQGDDAPAYINVLIKLQIKMADQGLQLQVPDVSPGPDGDLLYVWEYGPHHLECEIHTDGTVEFFYKNRDTAVLWYLDAVISDPIPEKVFDLLLNYFTFTLGEVRGSH